MHRKLMNAEAREYFDKLPSAVQKQMADLGIQCTSKAEVQDYFENVLRSGED